jgi:hypothetical protein
MLATCPPRSVARTARLDRGHSLRRADPLAQTEPTTRGPTVPERSELASHPFSVAESDACHDVTFVSISTTDLDQFQTVDQAARLALRRILRTEGDAQ